MNPFQARATLAASLALLAALTACDRRVATPEASQPLHPSVEINRQGEEGAQPSSTGVGVKNSAALDGNVHRLGAAAGPSVLDPDVLVATRVQAALQAKPEFGGAQLQVKSRDGDVTLRGRAPDPATRERATDIARSIPDVKSVDNELTLG